MENFALQLLPSHRNRERWHLCAAALGRYVLLLQRWAILMQT